MKLVNVEPDRYEAEGVPAHLQHAVKVLNGLLEINAQLVTALLDYSVVLEGETEKRLLAHPTAVCAEYYGKHALSALGLLNGVLMTPDFRLYVAMPAEGMTYAYFGIYKVQT